MRNLTYGTMDLATFRTSLDRPSPPEQLTPSLRALWYDAKGDWGHAHQMVQEDDSQEAAWVHAYLHRKEGDQANADYWYRRAGRRLAEAPLQEEWRNIAAALLEGKQ